MGVIMQEKPMIYGQMASVLSEVGSISKEKTSQGKFSFKYRSIDDVFNELHAAFAKHHIFLTTTIVDQSMYVIEGRGFHHTARYKFTFHAEDGSSISCETMGECIENGDKGIGKCASYALKTCLLQTFLIPTEDDSKDPDSTHKPVYEAKKPQPQAPKPVDQFRDLRVKIYNDFMAMQKEYDTKAIFPHDETVSRIKNATINELNKIDVEFNHFREANKK
jgi:hypothetical protein